MLDPSKHLKIKIIYLLIFICVVDSNSFQLNLLKELIKVQSPDQPNLCISPISIYQVLSLLLNGAKGKTQEEILNTLEDNIQDKSVVNTNEKNIDILSKISQSNNDIQIANAVLSKINPEESFKLISKKYEALCDKLVSVEQVNNWCSSKTNGNIKEIIKQIDDVDLILLNAVYFKGKWKIEFNKKDTRLMQFYSTRYNTQGIKVNMMYRKIKQAQYYYDDYAQSIQIPYSNPDISAIILLPNQPISINDFILNKLNQDVLNNYFQHLDTETINSIDLYLPKFKINYENELNDYLINMGIKLAFDQSNADFSNISQTIKLYLSKVIHKTFLEVDEKGTTAAAVTAAVMARCMPQMLKVVRPFVFIIRHKKLDKILFIAKIDDIIQ